MQASKASWCFKSGNKSRVQNREMLNVKRRGLIWAHKQTPFER